MIINNPKVKLNTLPPERKIQRLGFSSRRVVNQHSKQRRDRVQSIRNNIISVYSRYASPNHNSPQAHQPPTNFKSLLHLGSSELIPRNLNSNPDLTNRSHKSLAEIHREREMLRAAIDHYQKNHYPINCSLSPEKFLTQRGSETKLGSSLNLKVLKTPRVEGVELPKLPKLRNITEIIPMPEGKVVDHYQSIVERNMEEFQSSKAKVMMSLSVQNTKRLKKLIAFRGKQRAFKRWQTEQSIDS